MTTKFATIFREDLEYISRCILDYPNIETGGDFFGFWNNLGLPVIQYVIGPGKNSYHHVTFFKQDVDFLQKAGNAVYQTFGMQHIGSWHSHHKLGLAVPSSHDCQTMAKAINNNGLSQFFMILGNVRDEGTTVNGFLFNKQNQCRYTETQWRILDKKNPFINDINILLSPRGFFSSNTIVYLPKTEKARLINLKSVNPANKSVFVLDFEPEKWLGSKKGQEELKYVYNWILQSYPSAKMFVNEAKDLSIVAEDIKIVFPNDFPNRNFSVIAGEKEYTDDAPFEYKDKEDIVSFIEQILNEIKTI
jgi:hypothetical protein